MKTPEKILIIAKNHYIHSNTEFQNICNAWRIVNKNYRFSYKELCDLCEELASRMGKC